VFENSGVMQISW